MEILEPKQPFYQRNLPSMNDVLIFLRTTNADLPRQLSDYYQSILSKQDDELEKKLAKQVKKEAADSSDSSFQIPDTGRDIKLKLLAEIMRILSTDQRKQYKSLLDEMIAEYDNLIIANFNPVVTSPIQKKLLIQFIEKKLKESFVTFMLPKIADAFLSLPTMLES